MRDAEIEFNDIRHPYDATWPATSERLKQEGVTRTGKVPALLINGIIINQVSCSINEIFSNIRIHADMFVPHIAYCHFAISRSRYRPL